MVSLIQVSYLTSIRATTVFTSLIKGVSPNSVLNVVSSIILCHCDGVPRGYRYTVGTGTEDTGTQLVLVQRVQVHSW